MHLWNYGSATGQVFWGLFGESSENGSSNEARRLDSSGKFDHLHDRHYIKL